MRHRAAVLAVAIACSTPQVKPDPQPAGKPTATIVVTAELRGYLGPCGCSENMRGGVAHAAAELEKIRREGQPVFFVDSGDGLFGASTIPEEAVQQQERKARALADALKEMRLDVRQPFGLDDARGAPFRAQLALPELEQVRLIERQGFALGVVSGRSTAELYAAAQQARKGGAQLVLGLYPGPVDQATEVAPNSGVDLLVAARAKDEVAGELSRMMRTDPPVAQVQSKGRSLLRIDVWAGAGTRPVLVHGATEKERELAALDERVEILRAQTNEPGIDPKMKELRQAKLVELQARRAAAASEPPPSANGQQAFAVRFVPLEASSAEDAKVKAIVDAYDADVNELNLAYAKAHGRDCPAPNVKKGENGYVGNAACLDCHKEAFPVWQASKHAHGLATLEEKRKQYHLDCIGCHVTGWQRTGGVCRIDKPAGREGIGCESCHGPGAIHSDEPTTKNIEKGSDPKTCAPCHDRENSPHFEYEKYVSQIVGKGHGGKD